jgi:hypothetical protein
MKALFILSAVAVASTTVTVQAQTARSRPDSTCTKYSDGRIECRALRMRVFADTGFGDGVFMRMDSVMSRRAALGLQLRTTGTRRDTLGVFVDAVTPKGPADAAGIIEGDRIAAINGVDLRTAAADVDDAYSNGLASHRLSREVQKLTPGSRVTLRIYSAGRFGDVQVVAGKASDVMRLGNRFEFMAPAGDGMEFYGPAGAMRPGSVMLRAPRIELRAPLGMRAPGAPGLYRVELSADEAAPVSGSYYSWTDDNEPLSASVVRELVATAIQDARGALKQLAAAGVV